jgi:phosphohistidine phosphatase
MELLIFRHGPAGDSEKWAKTGKPDAARPLTEDGRDKTAKAAAGLASLVGGLEVVASSRLTRAIQTAELLASRFPKARKVMLSELEPGADPKDTLAALASLGAERVAVVGHEPHLGRLAAALLGAKAGSLELKKAGACLLEMEKPAPASARLLWLLRPSQLRALR